MKLAWILKWKIVNAVKFRFYKYRIELNLGWYTFLIWNRLQNTEARVTSKGRILGSGTHIKSNHSNSIN